eukprot:2606447-Amphidinium_carterae.1
MQLQPRVGEAHSGREMAKQIKKLAEKDAINQYPCCLARKLQVSIDFCWSSNDVSCIPLKTKRGQHRGIPRNRKSQMIKNA